VFVGIALFIKMFVINNAMSNHKITTDYKTDYKTDHKIDHNIYGIINNGIIKSDMQDNKGHKDKQIENREVELVPVMYRIRVPKLVLESRNVTWHGQNYTSVVRLLRESLCDGMSEVAIKYMVELVASGYYNEFWNMVWESFFIQGISIQNPSLAVFFLDEYRFLHNLKSKIVRYNGYDDVINCQIFRNHMTELITIFSICEHIPLKNELLYDGTDLIMEPINDRMAGNLANEYILMAKQDKNTCVELEELHYNLTKFFEAVYPLINEALPYHKNILDSDKYAVAFFWIYEIVKMSDIELREDFQNYLPKNTYEWTCHPSNILWNYLFIRSPTKIWKNLATLMEIYTINYKRKQILTCSAILETVLVYITDGMVSQDPYVRSRDPEVIRNVMKINMLMGGGGELF